MKNFIRNISLVGIILSCLACSESEIETYSGEDSIYFTYPVYGNSAFEQTVISKAFDSLEVSFAYEAPENVEFLHKIPVAVQGQVADYNRVYRVGVTNNSTAQEGVHYELKKEQVFEAGQNLDSLEITLLRTPDMKTDTITLTVELIPNDDFLVLMKDRELNAITGEHMDVTKFNLHITDILNTPGGWYAYFLGTFSVKKLFLMCDLLNIEPEIFTSFRSFGEYQYYGSFMQRYLDEQKEAGNTVYEEDGTEMVMGLGAQ